MRIKSELLWGGSIQNKSKVYDLLCINKLPIGYYLLVCTREGSVELLPSYMQVNRYMDSRDLLIFGVAKSKKEAMELVRMIYEEIYTYHLYNSIEEYMCKLWEEMTC